MSDTPEAAQSSDERIEELEDQLRRSRADFENLRKRFDREVGRERAAERTLVTAAWLPVVDDLERVLDHAGAEPASLIDGVRTIREQAMVVLSRLGYRRFEAIGEPFDPTRHEAVGTLDHEIAAGSVAATTRPGYRSEDEVLRPAGVMVSSGRV